MQAQPRRDHVAALDHGDVLVALVKVLGVKLEWLALGEGDASSAYTVRRASGPVDGSCDRAVEVAHPM